MPTPLINSLATHDAVTSSGYVVGNLVATGAAQFIKAPWGHLRGRRPWIACLVVVVDHCHCLRAVNEDEIDHLAFLVHCPTGHRLLPSATANGA